MSNGFDFGKKVKIFIYFGLFISIGSFLLLNWILKNDGGVLKVFKATPLYKSSNELEPNRLEKSFELNAEALNDGLILGTRKSSVILKKEANKSASDDSAIKRIQKTVAINNLAQYVSLSMTSGYMEYKGAWHNNLIVVLIEPGASIVKNYGFNLYQNLKGSNAIVLTPMGLGFESKNLESKNLAGVKNGALEQKVQYQSEVKKLDKLRKKEFERNIEIINSSVEHFIKKNKMKKNKVKVLLTVPVFNKSLNEGLLIGCEDIKSVENKGLKDKLFTQLGAENSKIEIKFLETYVCQKSEKEIFFY